MEVLYLILILGCGDGGGLVVRVLAFNSSDPSSNTVGKRMKFNNKRPVLAQFNENKIWHGK